MKREGDLFSKICSEDNLILADAKAVKGKAWQYGVKLHISNRDSNIQRLKEILQSNNFKTSPYTVFKIYEPKERDVYRLPFFPDRITHHAIMNVLEPLFLSIFTSNTYSCIKGKGIHAAAKDLKNALKDEKNTLFCLKLDIKKFYPSIDHCILKDLLRRKIKDKQLLSLLDEVIDSAQGVPIGNYLSQYLANFYLTYFDHWIKEIKQVRNYFRYADDIVILSDSKAYLHKLLQEVRDYLANNLKLTVKENYQVFPVVSRGIDFVGYVFYHTHTRLRKSIKQNFARKLTRNINQASIASYMGWAKHCDSRHLLKKLFNEKI